MGQQRGGIALSFGVEAGFDAIAIGIPAAFLPTLFTVVALLIEILR